MSNLVRKISSSITLKVIEPRMDSATSEISAVGLLLNILFLYGFGASAYIVPLLTGVYRRGFFCDDESIRFVYKPNTVPAHLLIILSIALVLLSIIACEYYVMTQLEASIPRPGYRWRNSHVHAFFVESLVYFGYSQVGFVVQLVLTQATKYTIGRLRPHFLDVCKPVNFTCTTDHDYISDYSCTGPISRVHEGRLSFFSGHSATATYSAVFAILYLQSRLGGRIGARLILPIVQTCLLLISLVICYTRITDNWHHWSDVLTGILVGTFVAIYTTIFWAGMFSYRHRYSHVGDPSGVRILSDEIRGNRGEEDGSTQSSARPRPLNNELPPSV